MPKYSALAGKFLGLLATGALLGFVRDKRQRRELLRDADRIWYSIDRKELASILNRFKLGGYIEFFKEREGKERVGLTERGRQRWLEYQLLNLKLESQKRWDKKWRLVMFDIPESKKTIRDALRRKLKDLGFVEFQKSVFVYPFSCREEINFILNFYNIPEHVYYLEAPLSPDDSLRRFFKLK